MGPSSSKLPPTQRIFPLSFEPSMIQDATYGGPVRRQVTENGKKDKGKQKVDPRREGEFPYDFLFFLSLWLIHRWRIELLKRAPVVEVSLILRNKDGLHKLLMVNKKVG